MLRQRCFTSLSAIALAATCAWPAVAAEPAPLDSAHAHNDYLHPRPLADALDLRFGSIEADVFRVGDELLVGHTVDELRPERTLAALYLDPLARRAAERGGWVDEPGRTVTLLIDFKTAGEPTYELLRQELARRRELFAPREFAPGVAPRPPVLAIISGNRPIEAIAADAERLCAVDGRLGDVGGPHGPELMPLVSDAWPAHFAWRGAGPMPADQRVKLRQLTEQTHAEGRRLRFWATRDDEAVWQELADAGVDLIGTDDLGRLARFLTSRRGE